MQAAFDFITAKLNGAVPHVGLVLGSGLGFFADELSDRVCVPYSSIPGFPVSTVEGHASQFVFGKLHGKTVVCMQGRFHFYEGYTLEQVTMPIRMMAKLGVKTIILTNAAGGINSTYNPGTLMLITDHINFMGTNPLIGKNDASFGTRFPDMSTVYSARLRAAAREVESSLDADLREGVYLAVTGPSYETPAEIRAFRTLGADAVGMSTVPEAIIARHAGVEVVGISCITNMAAGMQAELNHEEVTATAKRVSNSFAKLVSHLVNKA